MRMREEKIIYYIETRKGKQKEKEKKGGWEGGGGKKYSNINKAQLRRDVQRRIPGIGKVGILQVRRMGADDTLDEREVVEIDGSSKPDGDVDPG